MTYFWSKLWGPGWFVYPSFQKMRVLGARTSGFFFNGYHRVKLGANGYHQVELVATAIIESNWLQWLSSSQISSNTLAITEFKSKKGKKAPILRSLSATSIGPYKDSKGFHWSSSLKSSIELTRIAMRTSTYMNGFSRKNRLTSKLEDRSDD